MAGVKKGGTTREVINAIQTFVRSNRIKKIITDGGSQFPSDNFARWCHEKDVEHVKSTAYRPDNNQYAEACVKRVKKAIGWKLEECPELKISDHKMQSLVHDLAHEKMQGAMATPHQARYLTLGQDEKSQ